MKRRKFLFGSIMSLLGSKAVLSAEPQKASNFAQIIDTHQHLWDLGRFHLPWLKPGGELTRDFILADYRKATDGLGIAKSIYMEVAVVPDQKLAEAEYIAELCADKSNNTCAAVIGGSILNDGFKEYISRFKGSPYIKGVRHALNSPKQLEDERLIENLRLLGRLNMNFDLVIPPRLIGHAAELLERCEQTRFILDHCGNADPLACDAKLDWGRELQHDAEQWRRDIELLAKRKNVICKISGIIARVPKGHATAEILSPIVTHCLDSFGPDRVVFGSDWPVCTRGAALAVWVKLLREIVRERPLEERQKLFWRNAKRFDSL